MSGAVAANVEAIFQKKLATLYALAKRLALECVQEAQQRQLGGNEFWNNETKTAVRTLFGDAFQDDVAVGFFLAHFIEYGIYLELANDRQNAILVPMIEKYALLYKLGAQEIFGAAVG